MDQDVDKEKEDIRANTLSRANFELTPVVNKNHESGLRTYGLNCVHTMEELSESISNSMLITDSQDDDGSMDGEYIEDIALNAEDGRKKPLLVELMTFPGFNIDFPTPLPAKVQPLVVLRTVLSAQSDFNIRPSFRKVRQDFFLSERTQCILQDTFWWYFCHRYQNKTSGASRRQLFNRIAKEYTNMLINWTGSVHGNNLLKNFADVLSQAVYSTFYHAFSASYLHFNADFCDDLIALLHLWMMGVKPIPRLWEKWNFSMLHQHSLTGDNSLSSGSREKGRETTAVDDESSSNANISRNGMKFSQQPHFKKIDNVEDMMLHITSVLSGPEKVKKKVSCVAGGSETFHKVVFDTYGRSPLVEQFLASQHLLRQSGSSTLVQRTEIKTLPPLGAETYQDLIENVRCRSRQRRNRYRAVSEFRQKEHKDIKIQNKVVQNDFLEYAEGILTNQHEIRKMSALLRTDDRIEEKVKVGKSHHKSISVID